MLRRRLTLILLSAAFAALFLFPSFVALLTDWWWFQEIGYQVVFTRELTTRVLLFLAAGGLTSGVLYLNLRIAQRGLVPNPIVLQLGPTAPPAQRHGGAAASQPAGRRSGSGSWPGFAATPAWDLVLRVIYRTPFGIADPVFSRDIGFYVFTLPALSAALGFLSTLAVISLLLLIPLYWLRGDIVLRPAAAPHRALARGCTWPSCWRCCSCSPPLRLWLVEIPGLLYSTTGPLVGASYTDLHARLPALRVSAVLAVLAAVAVLIGGHAAAGWPATGSWAVGRLRGGGAPRARSLPAGDAEVRRGADRADPRDALSPVPHRRHAPGVGARQRGDPRARAARPTSRWPTSGPTRPTIENVRLWDREPLLQTFGQLQEIRTYYDFVSVDDDRYSIDGKYRQVLLSPRELNAGVAADPDLHQRAPHLHPRHGAHAGPGQPGDHRRAAGAVHQGPAAGLDRVAQGHPAADLLRRARQRLRVRAARGSASSTIPSGEANVYAAYERHAAASGSATCCAGCCSRSGSARPRSSSRRTSPTTAGCSIYRNIAGAGGDGRCRSSASIAIPTW